MALNKFGPAIDGRFSPDIGQYFYMVDSNYRTAAQGWSRPDGTGPLDLWNARQPANSNETRVFYTPEAGNQGTTYATQAAAVSAAVDAMIDFRGDTLYWTPGDYNIATAVNMNVPYARWLGREYKTPRYGCSPCVRNTTITCGVTNALTMSTANGADGFEIGYIRFVPITADESVLISAAQNNLYWHDFMVDFHGVTENAATAFCNITADGAGNFSIFDQFTWLVDEAQGPMFDLGGDVRQVVWSNFLNLIDEIGAAHVTSLLDIATAGDASDALLIGPGLIMCGAGTASTTFTQLVEAVAMTGTISIGLYGIVTPGNSPASTAISGAEAGDSTSALGYMRTSGGTLYTTA